MAADEQKLVGALQAELVRTSGGFLRNPMRPAAITCDICSTPVENFYAHCFRCNRDYVSDSRAADLVASMTYAIEGEQSGHMMRSYKYPSGPVQENINRVAFLAWLGMSHRICAGKLTGNTVASWATVPSLPTKSARHPLNDLVRQNPALQLAERKIEAATAVADPRAFDPANFDAGSVPGGEHVLLIDDTWASGGHAQSAAGALRAAGAGSVSILNVARWLNPRYSPTAQFIKDHWASQSYNPALCPWTGASCP